MIKPDNQAAIGFLKLWRPEGPWLLTCIAPDKKGIETRTFDPTSLTDLTSWFEEYNGQRNIYFHINPCKSVVAKKANRQQILSVDWLHIDLDMRPTPEPFTPEYIESERQRCLGLLTTNLPTGVPEPSIIVDSGGGYWGFWRLETPIGIDGDLDKAEEAKLYNLQLETLFGADNCHNIDRIARLPGTINIPDAKKKKKGRVPALSELHSTNTNIYPIDKFQKVAKVQTTEEGFTSSKPKVEVGGDTQRILDLEELDEWNVTNRLKIIIAQGNHPEEPNKHPSRSEWMLDVCANLVRCKVPDDIIYALITDPEWGISESVLELKSNAHKYAIRQIERGHEYAKDPYLEEFNRRFAVIGSLAGRCVIVEEIVDPILGRPRLTISTFADFKNRYCNKNVKIGETAEGLPKYEKLGKWWIEHIDRRQFDTITFAPNQEIPNVYNLWKGFACDALPGDCSLFIEHIKTNLCQGNEEHFNYAMGWMARMIQQPATPGEVALVLRGGRGTGKSFFATQLGSLLGRHFLHVSNGSHLTGNFNSHLRDLVLLFADEAFYANDKKHASVLKTLITEQTLTIERKGVDVENAPNFIHLIMASNDKHVVPAGEMERRFFVLDVGTEFQQNTQYFKAIAEQMDNGGREALLHMLREYDLSDFNVRNCPQTEALQNQKLLSLDTEHAWWFNKLHTGEMFEDAGEWPNVVISSLLGEDYAASSRKHNVRNQSSDIALGLFLKRVMPNEAGIERCRRRVKVEKQMADGYVRTEEKSVWHHVIPPLDECRAKWEEAYGVTEWLDSPETQADLKATKEPF